MSHLSGDSVGGLGGPAPPFLKHPTTCSKKYDVSVDVGSSFGLGSGFFHAHTLESQMYHHPPSGRHAQLCHADTGCDCLVGGAAAWGSDLAHAVDVILHVKRCWLPASAPISSKRAGLMATDQICGASPARGRVEQAPRGYSPSLSCRTHTSRIIPHQVGSTVGHQEWGGNALAPLK